MNQTLRLNSLCIILVDFKSIMSPFSAWELFLLCGNCIHTQIILNASFLHILLDTVMPYECCISDKFLSIPEYYITLYINLQFHCIISSFLSFPYCHTFFIQLIYLPDPCFSNCSPTCALNIVVSSKLNPTYTTALPGRRVGLKSIYVYTQVDTVFFLNKS